MLIIRQIYYFIKLTINTYFTRNLYYSICNDEYCNNNISFVNFKILHFQFAFVMSFFYFCNPINNMYNCNNT